MGALFVFLGCMMAVLAYVSGGWGWFLLWPALSFGVVGLCYGLNRPEWFGKSADGSLSGLVVVFLGPFLMMTWGTWHLARLLERKPAYHRVNDGLFVGRRLLGSEVFEGPGTVVDLTCEFFEPEVLVQGRKWVLVPTLDASVPEREVVLRALGEVVGEEGPVYVHCAQGHGRTGLFAAMLLGARGEAKSADEALEVLKAVRPGIRLNRKQRAFLGDVWGVCLGMRTKGAERT